MNNHHQSLQQQKQIAPSQTTDSSSPNLSISQLVDSGISALQDGNGNEDDIVESYKANNNHKKMRRKDVLLGAAPPTTKMSSLQMYIMEQVCERHHSY